MLLIEIAEFDPSFSVLVDNPKVSKDEVDECGNPIKTESSNNAGMYLKVNYCISFFL